MFEPEEPRGKLKGVLGIDEAGRGCIIGPMVLAAVLVDEKGLAGLQELGPLDSKALSRPVREGLVSRIESLARMTLVELISPQEIDDQSLNRIEIRRTAKIINQVKPSVVYFDVPAPPRGVENYCRWLSHHVTDKAISLVGENKADRKYAVVGAASILAKVKRDALVAELRQQYGDLGWGYPSEERTRQFLQKWYQRYREWPAFVRKKWRTIRWLVGPPDSR